jgi:CBS domain-containing protein
MQLIRDVIQPRDVYWIEVDDTVRKAVHYLCERKTGAVAVKEGDELAGIFSERDLRHRVVNAGLDPETTKVSDVMSSQLIFIRLDDEIHMAKATMYKNRVRHLVVIGKDESYKGLVSMRDLVEADMADSNELIHRLNDKYYEEAYKKRVRFAANRVIVEEFTG